MGRYWKRLESVQNVRIGELERNPEVGDNVIARLNDSGDIISVKSNSLGTVGHILGAKYENRSPNSAKGDSRYSVYRQDHPGFMPSYMFRDFLNNEFIRLGKNENPRKGDVAVMRTPREHGYYSILEAGLFVVKDNYGHNLFGQDDRTHLFGRFTWGHLDIYEAGVEVDFWKKRP